MQRLQRTLQKEISFSGTGLHSGKEVVITLLPAEENRGILFQRVDLPGKPFIPASVDCAEEAARCTRIGAGGCFVHTIEHLMAALYAYEIDNLIIQLNSAEPPIADGSALPFVQLIESAGIKEGREKVSPFTLTEPISVSDQEIHLVALPSEEFRISYTLHYPQSKLIGSQYFSIAVSQDSFCQEVAPCRTFALYDEINALKEKGLIQGGTLENAIVIKEDLLLTKGGIRFPDEPVRHKVLDLIGDLALVGFPLRAHIIAIRSGHKANVALGKVIRNIFKQHRTNII